MTTPSAAGGGRVPAATPAGRATGPPDRAPDPAAELRAFVAGELGDPRVAVEGDGPEDEVAVVRVPAALLPRMLEPGLRRRVVERARAAGYRYAAVELCGPDDGGPGA